MFLADAEIHRQIYQMYSSTVRTIKICHIWQNKLYKRNTQWCKQNNYNFKCVRLSRPPVGFQVHFKSLHFHFISFQLQQQHKNMTHQQVNQYRCCIGLPVEASHYFSFCLTSAIFYTKTSDEPCRYLFFRHQLKTHLFDNAYNGQLCIVTEVSWNTPL